jgi:hypothetical protein
MAMLLSKATSAVLYEVAVRLAECLLQSITLWTTPSKGIRLSDGLMS